MKKLVLILLVLTFTAFNYAEIQSNVTIKSTGKGINVNIGNPLNKSVFAGTLKGEGDIYFYCIDLHHELNWNSSYHDVEATNPLLTVYFK